ncbi:MAG: hypothetical protein U1U88_000237 [Lawsonella clevelandensis]
MVWSFSAGYVTEKALSVDNLFVFALILGSFRVPAKYQQKVLLIGIAIALALRAIFIGIGAASYQRMGMGLLSLWSLPAYTAIKLVVEEFKDEEPKPVSERASVKLASKFFHVSPELHGDRIMFRRGGKVVYPAFHRARRDWFYRRSFRYGLDSCHLWSHQRTVYRVHDERPGAVGPATAVLSSAWFA